MLAAMNDAILDEIYERSHGRQLTVAMLRGMLKQFFVEAEAQGKDLQPAIAKLSALVDLLPVRESTVSALRQNMTADEVERVAQLYRSPLGARFADFGVASAEEISHVVQDWATEKVVVPALVASGLDAEQAASMGIDLAAKWQPAVFDGPAASKRDASRAVVEAMGFGARIEEMVATQSAALTGQGLPAIAVAQEDRDALFDRVALLYARYFTADELAGLRAFYETPFGHRFLALTPLLGQAGQAAIEAWNAANPGELERQFAAVFELLQ